MQGAIELLGPFISTREMNMEEEKVRVLSVSLSVASQSVWDTSSLKERDRQVRDFGVEVAVTLVSL